MSPEFQKRLNKAIRLLIRETRDGCCECRERKGLCYVHEKEIMDMVLRPRESKALQELLK